MRGKLSQSPRDAELNRITPAYAGKTPVRAWERMDKPDHPRVCGENTALEVTAGDVEGSPPRMRGKLRVPIAQRQL